MTTAPVTAISCDHMLHYISQCLKSMVSYHKAHAFPLFVQVNGSLMVSNLGCHTKGVSFEYRISVIQLEKKTQFLTN
jgi:hypothetical protein